MVQAAKPMVVEIKNSTQGDINQANIEPISLASSGASTVATEWVELTSQVGPSTTTCFVLSERDNIMIMMNKTTKKVCKWLKWW
jgi:hypothetical protein